MTDKISAAALADVAQKVFRENPNLPYKLGGTDLRGMDSAGFIHYCCKQLGINASSKGTNTLYRQIGSTAITLKEALRQGKVVPGTILFHVTHNGGEPDEFKADGRGNATFAHICVDSTSGIYPSAGKKKITMTSIEAVSGKANMVAFHPALEYGLGTAPQLPTPPSNPHQGGRKKMIVTAQRQLILRKGPNNNYDVIAGMPKDTIVDVFEIRDGWANLRYKVGRITHDGWADINYLQDA